MRILTALVITGAAFVLLIGGMHIFYTIRSVIQATRGIAAWEDIMFVCMILGSFFGTAAIVYFILGVI